jgi:hypothetical protein
MLKISSQQLVSSLKAKILNFIFISVGNYVTELSSLRLEGPITQKPASVNMLIACSSSANICNADFSVI